MTRIARNVAAFAAVFALGCVVVAAGRPPIPTIYQQKKAEALASGPYDAVFVGSSWTAEGIAPAEFERMTGLRAFNLSAEGAYGPELDYMLRDFLASCETPPRYVFIELRGWDERTERLDRTARDLAWHTPRQSFVAASYGDPVHHAKAGLRAMLPVGASYRTEPEVSKLDPADGCTNGQQSTAEVFDGQVRGELGRQWIPREQVMAQQELCARYGAVALFYIPPNLHRYEGVPLPALEHGPEDHPELYRPEVRRNASHLNFEGSLIYTRLIAEASILTPRPRDVAEAAE